MPLRGDRIMRYVTAFCPRCHAEEPHRPLGEVERLAGYLSEAEGKVWLVRGCPRHGRIVTLYDEVPEILEYLEQWTAPTKRHVPDTAGNYDPVPSVYLRGLGELQTQHTCILLEDVTNSCNLRCPTCYAGSSPERSPAVPVETILDNVDQRLDREGGTLDVVMISGGEPTVHPQLTELLRRIVDRDITRVLLNTNGVRIAQDDELLGFLERHRNRVEVYLQFDGLRPSTHRHHRGRDLGEVKRRSLERLSGAGIFTTLTMTAALGVNDNEIGDVVQLAVNTAYVGGVCIQRQFGSGRSATLDPLARLTHTGVLNRLGPQTGGLVDWRDLTALPCSHPHCCSVGYLLRTDTGEWRSLVSIMGHDELKANLGLVSNRIADWQLRGQLKTLVKESLLGLLSERSSLTHPSVPQLLHNLCQGCDLGIGTFLRLANSSVLGRENKVREFLSTRLKRITVKPFMDIHTMLEEPAAPVLRARGCTRRGRGASVRAVLRHAGLGRIDRDQALRQGGSAQPGRRYPSVDTR